MVGRTRRIVLFRIICFCPSPAHDNTDIEPCEDEAILLAAACARARALELSFDGKRVT